MRHKDDAASKPVEGRLLVVVIAALLIALVVVGVVLGWQLLAALT